MILPVTIYGHPVLRKKTEPVTPGTEGLKEFIDNMFETMYQSDGVGLAAPQVNSRHRLFVVDGSPMGEDDESLKDFKRVFINPEIIERAEEENFAEEGCLSIPGIREEVKRPVSVRMRYQDENLDAHEETITGFAARIIQHEYDHLEGVLFTDKISPLRKRLLRKKLMAIAKGKFNVSYKVKLA